MTALGTQLKWLATAAMLIPDHLRGASSGAEPGLAARTMHEQVASIATATPQPASSLCLTNEHIIFSCTVKRSAKLVSLCASPELKGPAICNIVLACPANELSFPKIARAHHRSFTTLITFALKLA